jgi:hypothetical protein
MVKQVFHASTYTMTKGNNVNETKLIGINNQCCEHCNTRLCREHKNVEKQSEELGLFLKDLTRFIFHGAKRTGLCSFSHYDQT